MFLASISLSPKPTTNHSLFFFVSKCLNWSLTWSGGCSNSPVWCSQSLSKSAGLSYGERWPGVCWDYAAKCLLKPLLSAPRVNRDWAAGYKLLQVLGYLLFTIPCTESIRTGAAASVWWIIYSTTKPYLCRDVNGDPSIFCPILEEHNAASNYFINDRPKEWLKDGVWSKKNLVFHCRTFCLVVLHIVKLETWSYTQNITMAQIRPLQKPQKCQNS